jgi:uncharacterized protein YndB with AHSA1/START domain
MDENVLKVKTETRISRPVHEVFESIVDPDKMSHYFITTGSGRMGSNRVLIWTWADKGARLNIKVRNVERDRRISFLWPASGVMTLVEIDLTPADERATVVTVTEMGWPNDTQGISRLAEQTQGWVHFLCCLKAFLEFGINLRAGKAI